MCYNGRAMPSALEVVRRILLVAGEAALLYIASRVIFVWVLESAWGRAWWRRLLVGILRGPGNLLHELSHAVGYALAGYRVRRIVPFFIDPEGRGMCQPGEPWSPLALPWVATGAAALMPLLAGAVALRYLSWWLGVPGDPDLLSHGVPWRQLPDILLGMDYHAWQTWVFLYLALSIGAELAPSEIDLRKSLPSLAIISGLLIVLVAAVSHLAPDAPLRHHFVIYLGWLLSWMSSALDFGLMAVGMVMLPAAVFGTLLGGRRRRRI